MAICGYCTKTFEPRPRYRNFCSQACKNPINRKGNVPWNKGLTKDDPRVEKNTINSEIGLSLGRGWNKGKPNPEQSLRMKLNNPNKGGRVNLRRRKTPKPEGFDLYRRWVKHYTYRTLYKLNKQGLKPKTGKRKTDLQVDHILPFQQGFYFGIPPYVMGSEANIRFILGEENRKKWHKDQTPCVYETIIQNFIRRNVEYGIFKKST